MPLVKKPSEENRDSEDRYSRLLLGFVIAFIVVFALFYWWLLVKSKLG